MSSTAKVVRHALGEEEEGVAFDAEREDEGVAETETSAKRAFTRRTSHSKSDAYVALASASRASRAWAAVRRFVTASPPTAMVRVVSASSSASGRAPSSPAEISSAKRASPDATRAASSPPSALATSSKRTFPSQSTADATRKTSRVSPSDAPTERSDRFVASYAAASSRVASARVDVDVASEAVR